MYVPKEIPEEAGYKKGMLVLVMNGSNWLEGKWGIVVRVLEKPVLDPLVGDPDRNIVVTFPYIPDFMFPVHMDSSVPKEEKKWTYFKPENLKKHTPTKEELTEIELSGFGKAMRPYILKMLYDRKDGKCICEGCSNDAVIHIWVNIWGTGWRAHVCEKHMEEYKLCSCREDLPFTPKKSEEKYIGENKGFTKEFERRMIALGYS
jgi:hypothetical protein